MSKTTFSDWTQADADRFNAKRVVKQSLPTDKDCLSVEDAAPAGEEVEKLHKPFKAWCGLHGVTYVYSRPDRATTNEKGTPDFVCLKNGKGVVIEFKAHKNPMAKLRNDQREWLAGAAINGVPAMVTNSFRAATIWAAEKLGIEL